MMTSLSEPNLALYQIEQRLAELLELRNQAEEDGDTEALAVIDKQFEEYFVREVKKVDGICHALQSYARAEETARIEAHRLMRRADSLKATHDRIKAATLKAMQDHGVRVLETPTNKLRVQANGGLEPLEADAAKLTLRYITQTITLDGEMQAILLLMLEDYKDKIDDPQACHAAGRIADAMVKAKPEPNNQLIREALNRGEEVPGAKLLPRSFHLRIE